MFILVLSSTSLAMQAVPKPPRQGDQVRKVCVDKLNIHLGDSFGDISLQLDMSADPYGPSKNAVWVLGKQTDFVSRSLNEISLANGQKLRPMASLTFTGNRKLRRFSIAWKVEDRRRSAGIKPILDAVLEVHHCLKDRVVKQSDGRYKARVDYGTYSEELNLESSKGRSWTVTYEIREQP